MCKNKDNLKFDFKNRTMLELGSKLYPDPKSIIYEYISNSYDALAENIWISINSSNKSIEIQDDGDGMNLNEIRDYFLTVGSDNKRSHQKQKSIRLPIGKKGLGRLSVVGIGDKLNLYTRKDNDKEFSYSISLLDIEQNKDDVINDIENIAIKKGTLIRILGIRFDFTYFINSLESKIYLNFFPIINNKKINFKIWLKINNSGFAPITENYQTLVEDLEYIVPIDLDKENNLISDKEIETKKYLQLKDIKKLKNFNYNASALKMIGVQESIKLNIKGLIGLTKTASTLKKENIFENKIYIYARNRLIESEIPILSRHNYRYNVIGILNCEQLDQDGFYDIIQTNRSGVSETDNRISVIRDFINIIVKALISWKQSDGIKKQHNKKQEEYDLKKEHIDRIIKLFKETKSENELKEQIFKINEYKFPDFKKQIFISFTTKDISHDIAKFLNKIFKFCQDLIEEKFEINFLDDEDGKRVKNGRSITGWIRENVFKRPERLVVLVCLTKSYLDGWYTAIEFGASWGLNKKIFYLSDKYDPKSSKWLMPPIHIDTKTSYLYDLQNNSKNREKNIKNFIEDYVSEVFNELEIKFDNANKLRLFYKILEILNNN